jgi:hypothetical protein
MWIDGVKKLEHVDVNFRDSYDLFGWNHLILSPYPNPQSPADQQQHWDAIIGSTKYIAPAGTLPKVVGVKRDDLVSP